MDINEFNYELNKNNKFYSFISAIGNNSVNKSFLDLLKYNIDYFKEDINKPIYKIDYGFESHNKYIWNIKCETPASKIFDLYYENFVSWGTDFPQKVLTLLKDSGMDFKSPDIHYSFPINGNGTTVDEFGYLLEKEDLQKILKEKATHVKHYYKIADVFDENVRNEKLSVFIRLFHSQVTKEEFIDFVNSNSVLHNASSYGNYKLVDTLINHLGVDPNLQNVNGQTPVMCCKDINTFETLVAHKDLDLLKKDNENKDVLFYYGLLDDKKTSSILMKLVQTLIIELAKNDKNLITNLDNSNKDTLLAMVKSDKNKKELEDFIKRSSINDIGSIVDSEGRSLAQMCLLTDNWAKYSLFKNEYPANHKDEKGFTNLEYILTKYAPKFPTNAIKCGIDVLKDVNEDTGVNLLRKMMVHHIPFSAPKWLISSKTVDSFVKAFCGTDVENDFINSYNDLVRGNPQFTNTYSIEESRIDLMKELVRPYFIHAIKNNKISEVNDFDLTDMFKSYEDMVKDKSTEFSTNLISNVLVVNALAKELNFDATILMNNFENLAIDYIQKSHKIMSEEFNGKSNYHYNYYVDETAPLLSALVDIGSKRIPEALTSGLLEDIRSSLGTNNPVVSKLESSLLDLQLSTKNEGSTKRMKI